MNNKDNSETLTELARVTVQTIAAFLDPENHGPYVWESLSDGKKIRVQGDFPAALKIPENKGGWFIPTYTDDREWPDTIWHLIRQDGYFFLMMMFDEKSGDIITKSDLDKSADKNH